MQIDVVDLDETLTQKFVKFCCDQLGVYPDLIRIEGWDEPFKDGALGLCYEVDCREEYWIMVCTKGRNLTEIYNTIAHEMVHVKQFMTESLSEHITDEHKPVYNERWWEVEAGEKSLNLVKKYVDILYSMG